MMIRAFCWFKRGGVWMGEVEGIVESLYIYAITLVARKRRI